MEFVKHASGRMYMQSRNNLVEVFLRRLQSEEVLHPHFSGERLDTWRLDARDLGELLPFAWQAYGNDTAPQPARFAAHAIIRRAEEMEPRFSPDARHAALTIVNDQIGQYPKEKKYLGPFTPLKEVVIEGATVRDLSRAALVLRCCEGECPSSVSALVASLLTRIDKKTNEPHLVAALARFVGPDIADPILKRLRAAFSGSALVLSEIKAMQTMNGRDALIVAKCAEWKPSETGALPPRGAYPLSQIPEYVKFAENGFASALERVEAIHSGHAPYHSDKAFTVDEGQAIDRIARVGLDLDASWLRRILHDLWLKASVAPTKAKTMPSQSVAVALGRAVEDLPTPEAVTAMRDVVKAVRHAGVKKKLSRLLRTSERHLAGLPDLILRLPSGEPIPKTLIPTVKRSIEGLFQSSLSITIDKWTERFIDQPQIRPMTQKLIWRIIDETRVNRSAMPATARGKTTWRLVDGDTVSGADVREVGLWHPLTANPEERKHWRGHIMDRRIAQPFLQAFRQYYRPEDEELQTSSTTMFAGHKASIRPLMGVAGSQGWTFGDDASFYLFKGSWRFRFDCDARLFPGQEGDTTTGPLFVEAWRNGRFSPVPLATLDPVLLSEVLRSVDLLTSVGAFAYDPVEAAKASLSSVGFIGLQGINFSPPVAEPPVGQRAYMRREVLKRLYGRDIEADRVIVGPRHVKVGPYAIHVATGRVTRDGGPVDFTPEDLAKKGQRNVAWIPYEDKIMAYIVNVVAYMIEQETDIR